MAQVPQKRLVYPNAFVTHYLVNFPFLVNLVAFRQWFTFTASLGSRLVFAIHTRRLLARRLSLLVAFRQRVGVAVGFGSSLVSAIHTRWLLARRLFTLVAFGQITAVTVILGG